MFGLSTLWLWRVISLIALAIFVLTLIAIGTTKLIRNKYYKPYHEDELISEKKTVNSTNRLFFTTGETHNYIAKYVLSKTEYDKYLVCNYTNSFSNISYFVMEFNSHKKCIGVLEIEENYVKEASRIIPLSPKCKYANIVVKSVEGKIINERVIMPLSFKSIRRFSLLKALNTFSFIVFIRQILAEGVIAFLAKILPLLSKNKIVKLFDLGKFLNIGSDVTTVYLNSIFNVGIVLGSFVILLINYFVSVASFKARNRASKKGGVVEYEFL